MKKPRAFKRDAFLGIRLPDDAKRRLSEVARRRFRDSSNLALEYIINGLRHDENQTLKQSAAS